MPEGLGTPSMGPITSGLGETYQFEVRGEGQSLMDLRSILEWDIAFKLRSVPGVVEVNSYGGELKTYEVQIDPDKLVRTCLSDAERGRIESIPDWKWRAAMVVADHGPRAITRFVSAKLTASRKKH